MDRRGGHHGRALPGHRVVGPIQASARPRIHEVRAVFLESANFIRIRGNQYLPCLGVEDHHRGEVFLVANPLEKVRENLGLDPRVQCRGPIHRRRQAVPPYNVGQPFNIDSPRLGPGGQGGFLLERCRLQVRKGRFDQRLAPDEIAVSAQSGDDQCREKHEYQGQLGRQSQPWRHGIGPSGRIGRVSCLRRRCHR